MYIEAVPNRTSPPAILLRETYRQDGKICKRTLCNLSHWPAAHVEGLRAVLKGGTVIPAAVCLRRVRWRVRRTAEARADTTPRSLPGRPCAPVRRPATISRCPSGRR